MSYHNSIILYYVSSFEEFWRGHLQSVVELKLNDPTTTYYFACVILPKRCVDFSVVVQHFYPNPSKNISQDLV